MDVGLIFTTLGLNLGRVAGELLVAAIGLEFDCLSGRGVAACGTAGGKE